MGFDLVECAFQGGGGGVGFEGVENAAGGLRNGGCEVGAAGTGEEGDGEVAVLWGGEDTCDAAGSGGAGAEEDGEAGWFGRHVWDWRVLKWM